MVAAVLPMNMRCHLCDEAPITTRSVSNLLHHVFQAIVRRPHLDVQMLRRHTVRATQAFNLAVSERILDLQGLGIIARQLCLPPRTKAANAVGM